MVIILGIYKKKNFQRTLSLYMAVLYSHTTPLSALLTYIHSPVPSVCGALRTKPLFPFDLEMLTAPGSATRNSNYLRHKYTVVTV